MYIWVKRVNKFFEKRGETPWPIKTTTLRIYDIAKLGFSQSNLRLFLLFFLGYLVCHMIYKFSQVPLSRRLSSSIRLFMYSSIESSEYFEPPKAAKNNRDMKKTNANQAIHSSVVAITIPPPIPLFLLLLMKIPLLSYSLVQTSTSQRLTYSHLSSILLH